MVPHRPDPALAGWAMILGIVLLVSPLAGRSETRTTNTSRAFDAPLGNARAATNRVDVTSGPTFHSGPDGLGNQTSWQAMATPRSFPGLFDPSLATDPADGLTVMFGGCPGVTCSGTSYSNATWTYAAGVWERLNLTTSPPGRTTAQMAWDPAANEVILFGGEGCVNPHRCTISGTLNDTWGFANDAWTELFPVASPPPASQGSLAFDPSYPGVVLFGQYGYCPANCGTWVYSNSNWTRLNLSSAPPQRYRASFAEDPALDGALLYGGVASATGGYLSDTWLFSNGSWKALSPVEAPALRSNAAMTFDAALGGPVLFGGVYVTLSNFPGVEYDDTWLFGASGWVQLSFGSPVPGSRSDAALGFDPTSNTAVLVGGCGMGGCPYSETWALGQANGVAIRANLNGCANVSLAGVPVLVGASQSLLNASYSLTVKGCPKARSVGVRVEGELAAAVLSNNSTAGWNGTLRVYGSGTVQLNLTASASTGGSGSNGSASSEISRLLPLVAILGAAVATAAGILLYQRHRRAKRRGPAER
jgi:hypothetical protein